jgi:hypothetical protein
MILVTNKCLYFDDKEPEELSEPNQTLESDDSPEPEPIPEAQDE